MEARLHFKGLRPISINRAYYRNRKLTDEAREFRAKFLIQLQTQSKALKAISKAFNPSKHSLAISYSFGIPDSDFYTKSGHVHIRTQDLDNCLKVITDCICNKRYNNDWLANRSVKEAKLYKSIKSIENLAIDDKFITHLEADKHPSDSYSISITVTLLDPSPRQS